MMYIAYWLNVGHVEYDAVSQKATEQKKNIKKKSKKKKKSSKVE